MVEVYGVKKKRVQGCSGGMSYTRGGDKLQSRQGTKLGVNRLQFK